MEAFSFGEFGRDGMGGMGLGMGFGFFSPDEVQEIYKALYAGDGAGGPGSTNGEALRPESLENSLRVLTYKKEHFVLWRLIQALTTKAYNTVEQYNVLTSYGDARAGFFTPEGVTPEEDDSEYERRYGKVKFMGVTKSLTHPMTVVRTLPPEIQALENKNGLMFLLRKLTDALYNGNSLLGHVSSLTGNPTEWVEFDGFEAQIPVAQTIDLKNTELQDTDINDGSEFVAENAGEPNTLLCGFAPYKAFHEAYFPKERLILPGKEGMTAGLRIREFITMAGTVNLTPDRFLRPTMKLPTAASSDKAPMPPKSVTVGIMAGTTGDWQKSGAGTYYYYATAVNRFGESSACPISNSLTVVAGTWTNYAPLTILNNDIVTQKPEYLRIYRTEAGGSQAYHIANVPVATQAAGGATTWRDNNWRMPNTYTCYVGEMSQDVIGWKQLMPVFRMDLARISPAIRWMVLMYGTLIMYQPKKWVRMLNVKAPQTRFGAIAGATSVFEE